MGIRAYGQSVERESERESEKKRERRALMSSERARKTWYAGDRQEG